MNTCHQCGAESHTMKRVDGTDMWVCPQCFAALNLKPKWRIEKSRIRHAMWNYYRINTGKNELVHWAASWQTAMAGVARSQS